MSKRRVQRWNEQLRREVAEIIRLEVQDPRIGSVTVTGARVSPDLQQARVFVQVHGEDEQRSEAMTGLRAAAGFVRAQLADRIELRRVPEIRFELDESLDHAMRIERLLGEVLGERGDDEADPVD